MQSRARIDAGLDLEVAPLGLVQYVLAWTILVPVVAVKSLHNKKKENPH